jgi:hypothetical protein
MTLPSNSSMNYYPENTLAIYKTKLPQLFDLEGEWEVGLSEIQFPITWYNLAEAENHLFVKSLLNNGEYQNVSPPGGYYENPEVLIKQINIALGSKGINNVRFTFNEISKKVTIEYKKELISILMTKTLAELLGFDGKKTLTASCLPTCHQNSKMKFVINMIMIYSGIKDSQKWNMNFSIFLPKKMLIKENSFAICSVASIHYTFIVMFANRWLLENSKYHFFAPLISVAKKVA